MKLVFSFGNQGHFHLGENAGVTPVSQASFAVTSNCPVLLGSGIELLGSVIPYLTALDHGRTLNGNLLPSHSCPAVQALTILQAVTYLLIFA